MNTKVRQFSPREYKKYKRQIEEMDTLIKENIKPIEKNHGTEQPENLRHNENTKSNDNRNWGMRGNQVEHKKNTFSKNQKWEFS